MKKSFLILMSISLSMAVFGQDIAYMDEIKKYRENENATFKDPTKSPLSEEERLSFEGHDFYPIQEEYRVIADFVATPEAKPFPLATSTGTTQLFKKLGDLHFELKGESLSLEIYKEVRSFSLAASQAYLFLPVMDQTSGKTTYEAGRYLHFEKAQEGTKWVIDFNKLYNPYCAYNDRFVCPVVPQTNHLPIAIEAGVKDY